jgi:hypothetical protein
MQAGTRKDLLLVATALTGSTRRAENAHPRNLPLTGPQQDAHSVWKRHALAVTRSALSTTGHPRVATGWQCTLHTGGSRALAGGNRAFTGDGGSLTSGSRAGRVTSSAVDAASIVGAGSAWAKPFIHVGTTIHWAGTSTALSPPLYGFDGCCLCTPCSRINCLPQSASTGSTKQELLQPRQDPTRKHIEAQNFDIGIQTSKVHSAISIKLRYGGTTI